MAYNYIKVADRTDALSTSGIETIAREITEHDLVYCHLQGQIFRKAAEQHISVAQFAEAYMYIRITNRMDRECAQAGTRAGLEMTFSSPLAMESPENIVTMVMQLSMIPGRKAGQKKLSELLASGEVDLTQSKWEEDEHADPDYAYWLGYVFTIVQPHYLQPSADGNKRGNQKAKPRSLELQRP